MAKQVWILNILLLAVLAIGTGCSSKKTKAKNLGPQGSNPTVPNDRDDTTDTISGGETVTFNYVSLTEMERYTGRALDEIQDVVVNLDFEDVDPSNVNIYNGEIKIAYDEVKRDPYSGNVTGTVHRQGTFFSSNSDDPDNQLFDSQYNQFYNGAFKAFTQDAIGAVIVILDEETNDLGTWSGRIYYKNFNFSVCSTQPPYFCAPQPEKWQSNIGPNKDSSLVTCWFIQRGPYDCRDFLRNGNIRPDQEQYPSTYRLLGTFDNVDILKALNVNN